MIKHLKNWPTDECPIFTLLLALFFVSTKFYCKYSMWLISCKMLHFLHQLVFNFVCQLFVAEQRVHSEFYHLKQLPVMSKTEAVKPVRVIKHSKVAGQKTKVMSWKMLKRSIELKGNTRVEWWISVVSSQWATLLTYTLSCDPSLI